MWKFMFLSKALLFYWFPDPFNSQNHSPGPFWCKYWWHNSKSWISRRKSGFTINFLQALENEDKIMICSFFKFSPMKHFYGSKSIAWVDFRFFFDILFVSERLGWSGRRIWKINKIFPNLKIFKIYVTWLWQPISVEK